MKIVNSITLWMTACCFYNESKIISLFLFGFFFTNCIFSQINKYKVFLIFVIGSFYLFYVSYINQLNSFDFLNDFINKAIGIDFRKVINDFFIKTHGTLIGSFLSLILLNIKNSYSYPIYYKLISLSIVHLIVISGYHINVLCYFVSKVFKKYSSVEKLSFFFLSLIISYLNGFSASSLRVFCSSIFNLFQKTKYHKTNLSLILIGLISPYTLTSIGFCMSYLGGRGIKVFTKMHGCGKMYESIFSSIFATIYIIPFLATINDSISLWGTFISLLFAPIFMVLYFLTLIFVWVNWLDPIFNFAYNFIFQLSNSLDSINVLIPISFFNNQWLMSTYYLVLEILNLFIFQRRNTTKWKLKNLQKLY